MFCSNWNIVLGAFSTELIYLARKPVNLSWQPCLSTFIEWLLIALKRSDYANFPVCTFILEVLVEQVYIFLFSKI